VYKRIGSSASAQGVAPKLARIKDLVSLSKEAKQRLKWMDYYRAHDSNARLTCRHFGIHHRTFYRYYERFKEMGLRGLENLSKRPSNVRQPTTPLPQVDLVRTLRRQNPEYSKYKPAVILARDHNVILSASTVGRIITRYNLFFAPPVKPKRHPDRVQRRRKPKDLLVQELGDLVEVDVKHLPMLGNKRYAFVVIDLVLRRAFIHVASTISSRQAAIAWTKVCELWGLVPKAALNDNGSENLGAFAKLLAEMEVEQYFARPYTPKDKPHVERFIGTLERECIQWGGLITDLADQQTVIDTWLEKYHTYRPHAALGYLTPDEYASKLEREKVALM
jgi:transposase InsO family protein